MCKVTSQSTNQSITARLQEGRLGTNIARQGKMRRLIWHWRTGTWRVGGKPGVPKAGRPKPNLACATRKVNLKYRITSSIYKSSFLGSNFSKCEKLDWGCCPPVIFTSTLVSKNVKRNRPKEAKNQPRCRMTIQEEFLKFTFTMVCWRVINTSNVLSGMVWGDGVSIGAIGVRTLALQCWFERARPLRFFDLMEDLPESPPIF